jgi:hypothetical protein
MYLQCVRVSVEYLDAQRENSEIAMIFFVENKQTYSI